MAIAMPPSFIEITKNAHILEPTTFYNISKLPRGYNPYYKLADTNVPGNPRASFKLMYVLRSFSRETDNSHYRLFFVTTSGIYIDEQEHAAYDTPIRMMNIFARFFHDFGHNCLCINNPKKRSFSFLRDVKFNEVIGTVSYPNTFDFFSADEETKKKAEKKHELMIYGIDSRNRDREFKVPWHLELYKALKLRTPYLHLRSDNYVTINNIKFWNPRIV